MCYVLCLLFIVWAPDETPKDYEARMFVFYCFISSAHNCTETEDTLWIFVPKWTNNFIGGVW